MAIIKDGQRYFTIAQIARMLQVSYATVWKWTFQDGLKYTDMSKTKASGGNSKLIVSEKHIRRFVSENPIYSDRLKKALKATEEK